MQRTQEEEKQKLPANQFVQSRLLLNSIKRSMNGKNLTCVGVHQTLNQSTSIELDVQCEYEQKWLNMALMASGYITLTGHASGALKLACKSPSPDWLTSWHHLLRVGQRRGPPKVQHLDFAREHSRAPTRTPVAAGHQLTDL